MTSPAGDPTTDAPASQPAQPVEAAMPEAREVPSTSLEAQVARFNRAFRCTCGPQVFMRNSQCVRCGRQLGFSVASGSGEAIEPAQAADHWRLASDLDEQSGLYVRCSNLLTPAACNWLLPALASAEAAADPPAPRWCIACSLNRVVPDWSVPKQADNWGRVELAKRRLISLLLALGLPVRSRLTEDPARGLAFDFLSTQLGSVQVMTGHDDGVITINVDEADDAVREAVRASMHEPYRTMLGHLRHEVGHYYWDRLVQNTDWHEPYRALFGDESQDYDAALRRHYEQGPPLDWSLNFISGYASAHPWEDWAESWAHYLHMIDAMGTARSFGLNFDSAMFEGAESATAAATPAPPKATPNPPTDDFDRLFDEWLQFTQVLNEMSRSMGQQDFYPFIVATAAREKLRFVHRVITQQPIPGGG